MVIRKGTILFYIWIFLLLSCIKFEEHPLDPSGIFNLILRVDEYRNRMSSSATETDDTGNSAVATPTFNPPAGTHSIFPIQLEIFNSTPGASVFYTTDGSIPTSSSIPYNEPIHIWSVAGRTVRAIAVNSYNSSSNVVLLSGVFSYPPLKTGQTTIFLAGDNGTYLSGVDRSYTDNGNGTITDHATGLVWQRCTKGSVSATDCSGATASDMSSWEDSKSYCNDLDFAGRIWRLPTKEEFETLPDYIESNPAIEIVFFPETIGGNYWSSTPSGIQAGEAWFVNFSSGAAGAYGIKSNDYYVRCVSGKPKEYNNNFTENGNGTIRDNVTGLFWQKCSRGQSVIDCSGTATGFNWEDSINYCNGLSLAGRIWRLPTINELKTILDTTRMSQPRINIDYFPNTPNNSYWSSTTAAFNSSNAHRINFSFTGAESTIDKLNDSPCIRCVSDLDN